VAGRQPAQARGGREILSWDDLSPEARYQLEPCDQRPPEEFFDRRWAQTLVTASLDRMREEMEAEGCGPRFQVLKAYLQHQAKAPEYEVCARMLELSEMALKSAIYRLRRRYAEIIREEIGHTVESPAEVEEEIRHLIAILAG
jgi:hypothetical protein